ncbi:type I-C CRISPR-associated protein Cas5 [Heliobacterium undosum]|uniref:pre-crRNA processing endonuclease n=1 Tax=Heliomicrobium undosum TaxID=121734 RepID=A0A845L2J8_9FIRM|nr:type I-C CRISPR-associated protein Cas5c [Heliomicrobium undosum]MZP30797.1 type I-C CRISPR-associated protein Cas5 [Heliomicrobium undosum]
MGYGIKLKVWGDYACFTRPEMKAERVSYDVITPSAARGILEAIHWKPAIRWVVDRIHVLKEIRFENFRRNEVGSKISAANVKKAMNGNTVALYQSVEEDRQQRAALLLRNVAYVIEAHFEATDKWGERDTPEKHYNMFLRRAREGQCYHRPYLGCREFPAQFELLEGELPASSLRGERDLGWMLWDIDYADGMTPRFFRPTMRNGVIDVERLAQGGGVR